MDLRIKHTHDGSATLFNPQLDEHYHSIHGALTESRHVFIREGYHAAFTLPAEPLRILEVGFGTGLNAALTASESQTAGCMTQYVALEPFPVPPALIAGLQYQTILSADEYANFEKIHTQPWELPVLVNSHFQLQKKQTGILELGHETPFHLVYFDAFAPEKQPDMWTLEVLETCYRLLHPGGIFVTYCAKGQFKRNLKHCGFGVQGRPGPPGKREMTLAIKPAL